MFFKQGCAQVHEKDQGSRLQGPECVRGPSDGQRAAHRTAPASEHPAGHALPPQPLSGPGEGRYLWSCHIRELSSALLVLVLWWRCCFRPDTQCLLSKGRTLQKIRCQIPDPGSAPDEWECNGLCQLRRAVCIWRGRHAEAVFSRSPWATDDKQALRDLSADLPVWVPLGLKIMDFGRKWDQLKLIAAVDVVILTKGPVWWPPRTFVSNLFPASLSGEQISEYLLN